MSQQTSTNLRNRVNKLHLQKTKALLPLFEVISNSIHSIDEKKEKIDKDTIGEIEITILRNGKKETLEVLPEIDGYPIHSFQISDNGIGLNKENYASFLEFDSEHKATIGGKGIGRLVCLKAFQKLNFESVYQENGTYKIRKFDYKKTKEGFENYEGDIDTKITKTGSVVTLFKYEEEYQKQVPLDIVEIARQITSHFQLYFIQQKEPVIKILNQNKVSVNLSDLFSREFEKQILSKPFQINDVEFQIFISKSYKAKSHKINYCAHERTVKDEGLSKYIPDLKLAAKNEQNNESYHFQVFIVSDYLNKNVNEERTGFNFSNEDDTDEIDTQEITLAKIRNNAIIAIEELLQDYLVSVRDKKLAEYLPIIDRDFPNYHSVINYNKSEVEKLPVGLSKNELDLKLYEIEAKWKLRVKESGIDIVEKKKDITTLEEYKILYENFLSEFNEIGQSDLARYIVHRKAVIDLLDKLIYSDEKNKFTDEEIIHSLFFPIRETSSTVPSEKQNLWLIDERLTFNSLLASDKLFKQVESLNSTSSDRVDLIIKKGEVYENAALFAEKKIPFECFTIVEFKKPERNDYVYGDPKKDPVFQVKKYIRETIDGKTKLNGRPIEAKVNTPFYCYIVADLTPTLRFILKEESFTKTPDGLGEFRFYETTDYKAYIEVLPFEKVISDARQRNKILFDKLNLTTY
jgi:hypothetical protein